MKSTLCPTARGKKFRRAEYGFWKCRCCKAPLPEWSPYQRACDACRELAIRLGQLHGGKELTNRFALSVDPARLERIERYRRRAAERLPLFGEKRRQEHEE